MRQAAGGACFADEAFAVLVRQWTGKRRGKDRLDRHGAVHLGVLRLVNRAHRAVAEHGDDLITADGLGL